jgi:membrane-bound metal-dependent hydrolase YbcI (DUF457 family)
MPSPIGHALAGIAVAWGADVVPGSRTSPARTRAMDWYHAAGGGLTLACAILAAAPDLDLLFMRFHRTATHSLISIAFVALISAIVAGRLHQPVLRVAAVCAAAWGSHIVLDWLSADQSVPKGIQILWPFDATWFISGWDIFPGTERRRLFSATTIAQNATSLFYELAWIVPVVVFLWFMRERRLGARD